MIKYPPPFLPLLGALADGECFQSEDVEGWKSSIQPILDFVDHHVRQ